MSRAQAFSSFLFDSVNIIGSMQDEDLVFFLRKLINSQRRRAGKTVNIDQGIVKAVGAVGAQREAGGFRRISLRWFALGCSLLLSVYHMPRTSLGPENNSQIHLFLDSQYIDSHLYRRKKTTK